jgi:hypothetical protein
LPLGKLLLLLLLPLGKLLLLLPFGKLLLLVPLGKLLLLSPLGRTLMSLPLRRKGADSTPPMPFLLAGCWNLHSSPRRHQPLDFQWWHVMQLRCMRRPMALLATSTALSLSALAAAVTAPGARTPIRPAGIALGLEFVLLLLSPTAPATVAARALGGFAAAAFPPARRLPFAVRPVGARLRPWLWRQLGGDSAADDASESISVVDVSLSDPSEVETLASTSMLFVISEATVLAQ